MMSRVLLGKMVSHPYQQDDILGGSPLSRRAFLKCCALSLASLAASPITSLNLDDAHQHEVLGRVTRRFIYAHSKPDPNSSPVRKLERDTLLGLFGIVRSQHDPEHNPRWYRTDLGFVHSAYIQRLGEISLNRPQTSIPESGVLAEVTVPYTRATYRTREGEWMPLYRLYYDSLHWVTGRMEGPQKETWYTLIDERLRVEYYVPAAHLCLLTPGEFSPLSPNIPPEDKRIEVSLEDQTLSAYEGDRRVLHTSVSTGKRWMETPRGEFQVNRLAPSKHMGSGALTGDINAYELVGVPWCCFFHTNGVAFHGAFWHDDFGRPLSQGCVNLRPAQARWLFRWCTPTYAHTRETRPTWSVRGEGTRVVIR